MKRGFIDLIVVLAIALFAGFVYLVWNNAQLVAFSIALGLLGDWAVRR